MKTITIALMLFMVSVTLYGQRNSKVDPKDAQIDTLKVQVDSLSKVTKSLSLQLDSVSGELVKYLGVYNAIKDKVLHYAFDPTRSAYLIDSLQAIRDSTAALLALKPVSLSDTSKVAPAIIPLAAAPPVPAEDIERAKALSGIKQLKELLDAKIITDAEFLTLKQKYLGKL